MLSNCRNDEVCRHTVSQLGLNLTDKFQGLGSNLDFSRTVSCFFVRFMLPSIGRAGVSAPLGVVFYPHSARPAYLLCE